jgi:hypothetical protein
MFNPFDLSWIFFWFTVFFVALHHKAIIKAYYLQNKCFINVFDYVINKYTGYKIK